MAETDPAVMQIVISLSASHFICFCDKPDMKSELTLIAYNTRAKAIQLSHSKTLIKNPYTLEGLLVVSVCISTQLVLTKEFTSITKWTECGYIRLHEIAKMMQKYVQHAESPYQAQVVATANLQMALDTKSKSTCHVDLRKLNKVQDHPLIQCLLFFCEDKNIQAICQAGSISHLLSITIEALYFRYQLRLGTLENIQEKCKDLHSYHWSWPINYRLKNKFEHLITYAVNLGNTLISVSHELEKPLSNGGVHNVPWLLKGSCDKLLSIIEVAPTMDEFNSQVESGVKYLEFIANRCTKALSLVEEALKINQPPMSLVGYRDEIDGEVDFGENFSLYDNLT